MSSDESSKDPILNGVTIDLIMLGALIKGEIICNEDDNLIVTID